MQPNVKRPVHVNDNSAPGLFQGAPELQLRQEVLLFQERFPALDGPDVALPRFTWGELERQLQDLAATARQRELISSVLSATRKLAPFKPRELVLREILLISAVLQDEAFGEAQSV